MIDNTDAVPGNLAEAAPRYIIGSDPFDREPVVDHMRLHDYSHAGAVAMSGIALIEMACWDIAGKALNQPVYRLMGGAVRPGIKAYANGWYTVERTPEEFAKAARKVADRGYRAAKLEKPAACGCTAGAWKAAGPRRAASERRPSGSSRATGRFCARMASRSKRPPYAGDGGEEPEIAGV